MIASGGQQGPTLGETALGLEKLQMQQEELGLKRQEVQANLQNLRERKQQEQQKRDILASSQADALRAGGTPEQQQQFFQEVAQQRAQQTGRIDIVEELKDAYRPEPAGQQPQKWQRIAQLAALPNRTDAEEREYQALTERGGKTTVARATRGETLHAKTVLESSAFNGELENSDQYVQDLAARAKAYQVEAADNGQVVGYDEALAEAEAQLAPYVIDRKLTVPLGRNNFSYEPPEGGISTAGSGTLGDNPTVEEVKAAGRDKAAAWMKGKGIPQESIDKALERTFGKSKVSVAKGEGSKGEGSQKVSEDPEESLIESIKKNGINTAISNWLRENQ